MTTTRPPSKPWRVYGARGMSTDYRSQRAAYEAAKTITKGGNTAKVYHWEQGQWVRYEVLDPDQVWIEPAKESDQ